MVEQWYCQIAGREVGPLSGQQLKAMAERGQILPSDCVRIGSQGQWVLARQVKGLFPTPPVLPPRRPAAPPATGDRPAEAFEPDPQPEPPGAVSFDFVDDLPAGGLATPGKRAIGLSSTKRRQQQQRTIIGLTLAVVLLVAIVGIWKVVGGGDQPTAPPAGGDSAEKAAKAHEEDAAKTSKASPEAAKQPSAAEKPVASERLVDASTSPATVGDVAVKIASVVRPAAGSGNARDKASPADRLLITVEVRNTSEGRKVEFSGWIRDGVAHDVTLSDNFGNVYRAESAGSVAAVGEGLSMLISPGKACKEVLAFESPLARAGFVLLELPAAAFGGSGAVKLKIPVKMIVQEVDAKAAEGPKVVKPPKKPSAPPAHTPASDFGIPEGDAPE